MLRILQKITVILFLLLSQTAQGDTLSVTIEGLPDELREHVEEYLDIHREQSRDEIVAGRLQRLHVKAEEQIKSALQVYGFYKPAVTAQLLQDGTHWNASYTVTLNAAITIHDLKLEVSGPGRDDRLVQLVLKRFPIQQGQVFEHPRYDEARDTLLRAALEQGYLDARMETREVRIDLRQYRASIHLHMQTGQRYFFGDVQFIQDGMQEDFLARYVKFKSGDPYNPATLLQLQMALSDSGLFQAVEVRPDKQQALDNHVPVLIYLTSRKPREWRFGLGYATDTGARGSISHTRIIGDKGHKFDTRLLISEKRNSMSAGYVIPLENPAIDKLGFGAQYTDETTDSRESQISGIAISHTTNWGEWLRVLSLNYEREVYIVATEPEETRRILFPVLRLERVRADDRLYSRHGSRVIAELRGANENLLSDTNFGQLRLGLKWIRGVTRDSRIILRGDFGTTNVGELDRLPASQRFFAGGDNSVRGYAYEELGPVNSFGEVVGGKHLLVGSVELEHKLSGNWSAAAFYDAGNAINSFGDELAAGAGVGLRWNSPVGPIRFDFAWALDKPEDRFRLHVVIGPDL